MNGFYLEPVGSHNGIPLPDFKGYTCGRQRTNDIMLNSVTVSREHCTFTVSPNHFQVYDLQSANGTYINGQRVQAKVFHTVRIGNALGISCHKTEDHEFEENEVRFVYRLRRLPVDYSKKMNGNLKDEVGEKRKSNGKSPVPYKVARLENVEDGYVSDDDCIMIEDDDPVPNVQPEPRLPIRQPSTTAPQEGQPRSPIRQPSTSAPQVGQQNSLIKYELDIPEEGEEKEVASEENLVINNRPDPKDSAQTSTTNPAVNGSTSRIEESSLAARSSSLLNDEANSNDIFSDSPASSPKITAKNTNESVVVKQEPKIKKDTDASVDVIQIDNDDVVVFPASQLFDDEEAASSDDNNTTVDAAPVSSIIKEECDLGTDDIDCYNGLSSEEAEESEYPVIVLSDDEDEYDSTRDPWLMKLSGSQLESRSSSEIESLKLKEEPIDQNDDKEDEIVNGLLDSLEKEAFMMETEDAEMSDGVTVSEDMVTDQIECVKEPVKLTEAAAAVAISESVGEKDVKKEKKDKKNKIPEDRRKESHSKPKDKSKNRKSERDSSSKDLPKQAIDTYEFRTSFEEPRIGPYQSTKKGEEAKKIKKIVIRSNIEFKTPIVKSILADEMLPRPSKESKVDKNEKPVEKDGKEERKDKGAIKKHKVVQEVPKDQVRVEEKIKRAEKDKPKNKKKNKNQKKEEHKKNEEKVALIPFEEALMEGDKNIIDDKKKIKKRKTSQESSEERKSDESVASTSAAAEPLSKEPAKAETETKTLVIDGRRVSISKKVEKKIKTIEPPIFTRGGRHGVSATLSAFDAALNTPKVSDEAGLSPPTGTDNQEEDYNSDLFSKPTKLANSSKSNNPMEQQKNRLRRTFREEEILKNVKSIRKAKSKQENKYLKEDRKERLKQLTEKPKGNDDKTASKRVSKAVVKVSKNRGMFLVPEGVNLDDSKDEDAAKKEPVKINNGPTFDLHVEGIKNNHINANSTTVDDLSDVISTNSVPGYPEPPPQEDKDTDSDSSHDMNAIADPGLHDDIDMEDTLMDYIDTPTTSNGRSASSSPDDYSPPKINYSRQITKVSPKPCTPQVNQVFSRPPAASRLSNLPFHQPSRLIRGILKKAPERGQANYLPNGISSNNLPQIGKPKKRIRFATTPPVVHLIDILPGNKLIRKCIQKDAAMPKTAAIKNTLPGDPSTYLPNLSTIATPKALPAPPSAPALVHQNALTSRHTVSNIYNEPRRISGPQLDEFLLRVFDWNPQWLDPEAYDQKSQRNLPIVPAGQMPHLSSYANYSDYYSIMADLLLLEMWAGVVRESNDREFMKARRNMHAVIGQNSITQTPIRSTNHTLTVFTADILCSKSQIDSRQHATPGELVMLELPIVVENEIHFRPIFAYVKDYQKTVITPSSTPYNKYLQNTVPNPYAVVTLTMSTKSLPLNIKFNRVLRMKTRFYMRPNLRMVQAILHLPSNPLLHHIIQPDIKKEGYELTKVTKFDNYKFATGDALNERQMEAVLSVTNAVLEKKPKICLVEGPPGTGKSRVIVNIITEIMYGQNRYANNDRRRILVCAPSNAAVDEITMRLLEIRAKFQRENSPDLFRLVRVGNTKMMHPRVKDISLSELVDRAWAAKGPGDVSADNEINRLQKHILELKATMASFTEPIPEGDRLKLKKRLEDWTNQLALLQASKQVRHLHSGKRAYLENKLLSTADIITCTLSSCYTQPMELAFGNRSSKKISICIVDEATQSTEPETLIPLMLGVLKLVLVGDPQQLPATVLSSRAKELNYDKSLFSRIHEKFMSELENPIISLNTQYRMAHPIVYWPNRFFYSNQLQSSVKPIVWPYSPYKVFNLTSVQDNNQFSNSDEATYVVNLIHAIVTDANLDKVEGVIRIGVITPYQDQRKIIQRKMEEKFASVPDNIKNRFIRQVSTVDGFQGQEREIIIMSCVRSNGIGFLTDRQRLCVALTRAKHSLFLCGNFKTFERDETWGALIKDARSRNFYINTDHRTDQERIKQNIIKLAFMK